MIQGFFLNVLEAGRPVINHYVFIRGLFNKAIRAKLVDRDLYPFRKGKVLIKFPETTKVGLDADEIKELERVELKEGSSKWHARKLGLFYSLIWQ